MSYAFDTLIRALDEVRLRASLGPEADESLALIRAIKNVIEDMHSVNHNIPSTNGLFHGDGVNKAASVSRSARELEEILDGLKKQET